MEKQARLKKVANKIRKIANSIGGSDSSDGLFLMSLSDAIEHGDRIDALGGQTLAMVSAPRER